jgi:hypothetical protein
MIQTFDQRYTYATPPAIGEGSGVAMYKSPKFNILTVDKYGQDVNSRAQYSEQNSLYYNVSVYYSNGIIAPNGTNFETGLKDPNYTFTYEKNTGAFNNSPQRNYTLAYQLFEVSPAASSSGKFNVYHNQAELSGVSGVLDGKLQIGDFRNRTGAIDINVSMLSNNYYTVSKFEIYSGSSSNFAVVTGTGANSNLMKTVSAFEQKRDYTLTINDGEQPANNSFYFYKILPYDDFGSGVLYSSPPVSGLMYAVDTPAYRVDNITGKNFVMLNSGSYVITTFHTGQITGVNLYNLVDSVANISGNIIGGGHYNLEAIDDFDQNHTQLFKTIKYLAQTVDGTGNVSSREILITDNTTSMTGGYRTGIIYSEYAVSDNSQSAQFLVSGSGYLSGTGHICLFSKVNYPTGSYKLLRTIM